MQTENMSVLKFIRKFFIQYLPAPLQQPLRRFFIWPLNRLMLFVRDIRLPVYRIERAGLTVILLGHEACDPLGTKVDDPYINQLLFGEYTDPIRIGTLPIWGLSLAMRRWENKADLIIFRHKRFKPEGAVARRMITMPYYVSQYIDLPPTDADLLASFRNSQTREDLRKIRKAGFQYEMTQDPVQLDYFYHHMYRPYVQDRHGDSLRIMQWEDFRKYYEKTELLLIRKDGLPVAGNLILQNGNRYTCCALGVVDSDTELVKKGALAACYWFSIAEAHRRGCAKVNLECARPFLKDGVLAYKKKWGSRIEVDHVDRELWLLPCGKSSSLHRFLEENPFICEQDDRLASLIFLGAHTTLNDEELSSYLKGCHYQGDRLSTCIVLLNSEWAGRAETIHHVLHELPPPNHILDLSHGSLTELPALISRWLERIQESTAEFPELAYSQ